ncbi:MAG: sulfatase [Rikenellaceae bacterium]
MKKYLKYTAIALPVASTLSCAAESIRPNIVCIVSEDNNKEYMSLFCEGMGTKSPAIEALAAEGVLFENCSSNAPVSSAARSTLISGCYGVRSASHYHRGEMMVDMPDGMRMFPAYLRDAGYYTANNAKEDYNIIKGDDVWDDSSRKGSWRNRAEGQPFYYVHNLGDTHEGQMIKTVEAMQKEIGDYMPETGLHLQPNYPDTELFRTAYIFYCKRIEQMDAKVGAVVAELEKDGLLDNTIILYYGDNGGIMPNSKGYLTEMGLNVPLVVRFPEKYKDMLDVDFGSRDQRFVSFVDLAPTILEMAGVEIPKQMDGKPIWDRKEDDLLFGYADRMGEKYDMVRSVRKGNYKYVRSFQPFNFDALSNDYRYLLPTFQELREMHRAGELNATQEKFFEPKGAEMLFDLSVDPYELNDLSKDKSMQNTLLSLRKEMIKWQVENHDIGLIPEYLWIREAGAASTNYGAENSKRITKYLNVANLQLESYDKAKKGIQKALGSSDMLDRYWALNVCSSFGLEAKEFVATIRDIAKNDAEAVNRVRAAEYLALYGFDQPQSVMVEALYSVSDPVEAALILNSMTLLNEGDQNIQFTIEKSKLGAKLPDNALVKSALSKHTTK